jgi:nucleoside-diphosphate-sugar epimerase
LKKKILVTGASGFTGSALCRRLVTMGEDVVAFVRPSSRAEELTAMGVEIRVVDIKDPSEVLKNFDDIDRVYHIAAAWRTEHSDLNEFRLVNVEASRNLLEAAVRFQVKRFVHCSTVGVQGHIDDPPAGETYRYGPGDHYQRTKMEGEVLARKYFEQGLPGVVVRPAGIYGPGDVRFLKLFRPIHKGFFVMIGSGKTLYHFTYIDDLVDGFMLAGTKDEALGEVFTIAGREYISLSQLVNTIAEVLGKPRPWLKLPYYPVLLAAQACDRICRPLGISPPLYPRRVEFFVKDRAFSIEKAQQVLGYRPRIDLVEGLRRTAEWYREKGYLT